VNPNGSNASVSSGCATRLPSTVPSTAPTTAGTVTITRYTVITWFGVKPSAFSIPMLR
jgi:hypothetical protein